MSKKEEELVNLRVRVEVKDKAKEHAENIGITLKEFTEEVLRYFIRYKLNPFEVNQTEDLPKEVNRLRNHIFSFLKTQEQQLIIPLLEKSTLIERNTKSMLEDLAKLEEQLYRIYILLFKIKTIQDISLSTLYNLSDQDDKFIEELIKNNKLKYENEINNFESQIEQELSGNRSKL